MKHKSGAAGGEKSGSSWPYFESLYFLADQMTPRQSSGNTPLPIEVQENSLLETSDEEPPNLSETQTLIGDQDAVIHNAPSTSTVSRRNEPLEEEKLLPSKKSRQELLSSKKQSSRCNKQTSDVQNRMLELEEEKLQLFKQRRVETDEQKDYDYHFLMSLLPHLRIVKPERKLLVQSQLQQVLINEITPQSSQRTLSANSLCVMNPSGQSYTPQPTPSPAFSQSSHSSDPPFSSPSILSNPPTQDATVQLQVSYTPQPTPSPVFSHSANPPFSPPSTSNLPRNDAPVHTMTNSFPHQEQVINDNCDLATFVTNFRV